MWTQIVGGLLFLIVGTYAVQLFMPRSYSNTGRTSARMDVAPALGFFGVLLLVLSLVEAIRSSMIEAWVWGIAVGVILGIGAWIALGYRIPAPVQKSKSALLATFRLVRVLAMPVIVALIAIYLAERILGPVVQVLVANAFGIMLMVIALRIFVGVRKTIVN